MPLLKPDAMKTHAMLAIFGTLALTVILLTGCATMGPATIKKDRFDYVSTISESWKRQTLLNLVKTRYLDAPVFLDIASVINQYSMEGELSLGVSGEFYNRSEPSFVEPRIGATGRYADRPTITYNPLMGQNFARSLMRPIPLPAIFALLESGYPADTVLQICTQRIQGLKNCRRGALVRQEPDPEFYELLDLLRKLKDVDAFTVRLQKSEKPTSVSLIFKPPENETAAGNLKRVAQLLDLDAARKDFPIVPGSVAVDKQEIAIASRSIMQIMMEYASYIDVPELDIAEGRVYALDRGASQTDSRWPPLIKVHSSATEPERPYVAVPYRDSWFWIDDRDIPSKARFYFLMILSSLTERGDGEHTAPIISVPTN